MAEMSFRFVQKYGWYYLCRCLVNIQESVVKVVKKKSNEKRQKIERIRETTENTRRRKKIDKKTVVNKKKIANDKGLAKKKKDCSAIVCLALGLFATTTRKSDEIATIRKGTRTRDLPEFHSGRVLFSSVGRASGKINKKQQNHHQMSLCAVN